MILYQFDKIPTEPNLARLKLHQCFDVEDCCYQVLDSSEGLISQTLKCQKRTDNEYVHFYDNEDDGDDDDDDDDDDDWIGVIAI